MQKPRSARPQAHNQSATALRSRFMQGVALYQQGRLAEAERIIVEVLQYQPKQFDALHLLGIISCQTQRTVRGVELIRKAIKINPKVADAHYNLGNALLLDLNCPEEAIASYDKAIALKADLAEAYSNRGIALRNLKRPAEALKSYEKAIALKPDYAEAYSNSGNALLDLKRPAEALTSYDKAIVLKADLTEAWLGRGDVFRKLKHYDEAIAAYDKALALKPDFAEAWLGRGNISGDLKRYDEAFGAFDKAVSLEPDLAEAWLGCGNVFHALKRYDEALVTYDKALALKPKQANAWISRGEALAALRRVQESIVAFREALKYGGDSELIMYTLAALGAEHTPIASPERYIVDLFDSYAVNFDRELVDNLKYQTPTLLVNTIKQFISSDTLDILDLGCGTGLVGECIRPFVRTLTGVDLSANMLQRARQRDVYDRLICSELTKFLQTQDRVFDLAIATDVFIYIGELSVVFREVRRTLRDGGVFCFSVEATDENDFVLRNTRRFAHSIRYLERLAEKYRFAIKIIEPQIIRQEDGADINGYHAILGCL